MDQETVDPQDGAKLSADLVEPKPEQRVIECKSIFDGLVTALSTHGKLFGTHGKHANTVRFDLLAHSAFVGNHFIITRGKLTRTVLETATVKVDLTGLPWLTEDERNIDPIGLFHDHYLSRPNGEERYMTSNFPAKPCDEMTDDEITQGMPRGEARIRLEAWMLCAALDGTLERYVKTSPGFAEGNWWWAHPSYKDDPTRNLVIKKAWWDTGRVMAWTLMSLRGCRSSTDVLAGARLVATVRPDASPVELRGIQMSQELLRILESFADAAFRLQIRYKTSELDPLITDANRIIEYIRTGKARQA